jgi:preprotein translocase subunit SecF
LCLLAGVEIYRGKVKFDYNLMQMQSPSLSSVIYQQVLFHSADKSLLLGDIVATNLDEAIALESRILKLPSVADIDPPQDVLQNFMESNQVEKLPLIRGIKKEVAPVVFSPPDSQPVDLNALSATLYSLSGYCGAALGQIGTSDVELSAQLTALRQAIEDFRKTMLAGDDDALRAHAQTLAEYQLAFFDDVRDSFDSFKNQNTSAPLRVSDLPVTLRDQFLGQNGEFLLQIYSKSDVWQRPNQQKFVTDLRSVDPNATGSPVQLYEYETLLKDSYIQAAWYALIAISLLVFVHFRSFSAVILALLPVVIGSLWLAGCMGYFNVAINLANIMTLPLVIGIGVTNGIQILNRFAEERTPGILSRSTGKAVLVSGLTAISGFGSLILAKHRGMHSLGLLMAMGIGLCMIAALTFLPAFLNLFNRRRPMIKNEK